MRRLVALTALLGTCTCTSLGRLALLRGGGRAAQLIDAAGALNQRAATELAAGSSGAVTLIASYGAHARARRLLNDALGTEFDTATSDGGAWLSSSSADPSVLALAAEGTAGDALGAQPNGTGADTLGGFSLALADAVLVHTPSTPSVAQLQAGYERLFSQHLALGDGKKTLLVHVGEGEEKAVRRACAAAWEKATAAAALADASFEQSFDLECVALPHRTVAPDEYAAAAAALGARLRGLAGAGYGKALKAGALGGASEAAWSAACAAIASRPSEGWMCERFAVESAYDAAYSTAQETLRPWSASVAQGKWVPGFGAQAAQMLDDALASFAAATADAGGSALVAARSTRLRKALTNDVSNLFAKQHKVLTTQQVGRYKKQLLKVVGRSGRLEAWQRDGLQRACEKSFDAGLRSVYVAGLNGPSQQQLLDAFSKQLTAAATAFQESPAMQLQAITAVRRRTGKPQKPPRGVRFGLGVVGACHSKIGGGQGNLQTFAGYTAGLNSAHVLFANDGAIPDSSGSEPDLFRFQPKLNFDIAF